MVETVQVGINYIVKTPGMLGGRARINGRRIGVSDVVNLHIRLGVPLEEIAESYDLTLAQIHAALAYYYDHPAEIDAHLDEEERIAAKYGSDEEAAAEKARLEHKLRERNPELYEKIIRTRDEYDKRESGK